LICHRLEELGQDFGQPGIAEAVHDNVHPDREDDDVPWRAFHDGLRIDRLASAGDGPEDQSHGVGEQGYRKMKELAHEVADQQDSHHHPRYAEQALVFDGLRWCFQLGRVIGARNTFAKIKQQHRHRCPEREQVWNNHPSGILREANSEIIRYTRFTRLLTTSGKEVVSAINPLAIMNGKIIFSSKLKWRTIASTIGVRIKAAPSLAKNAETTAPSKLT